MNNEFWNIIKKIDKVKLDLSINITEFRCYPQLTIQVRVLGGVHSGGAVGFSCVADSGQW